MSGTTLPSSAVTGAGHGAGHGAGAGGSAGLASTAAASASFPDAHDEAVTRKATASGHTSGPGEDSSVKPLLAENLGRAALGADSVSFALSKPTFRPDGYFVCGTEIQTGPEAKTGNRLVFSRADFDEGCLAKRDDGTTCVWTYPLTEHVRDIEWMDQQNAVVAVGKHFALLHVDFDDDAVKCELVGLPEFHTDAIREISINPAERHLVLSGGFDGRVFVTDLLRIMTALQEQSKSTENILYPCDDVVGSVQWVPSEPHMASVTTDDGVLHVFDIRSHLRSAAVVYDVGKAPLFGHSYINPHTVVLGFGDGTLQLHDMRLRRCILTTDDAYQSAIGDVRCTPDGSSVVLCGQPGVSVWACSKDPLALQMRSHHRAAEVDRDTSISYKISGSFIPETPGYFGAADSFGNILVLDTNTAAASGAVGAVREHTTEDNDEPMT